jgi:8-oxo-dGTP pyrophosphatase MutT (NUDIX family)
VTVSGSPPDERGDDGSTGSVFPAATVVLVRDHDGAVETLMLRRNSKIAFGGHWVFPGGRIEDADRAGADDVEHAARRAAVREAMEEADLRVDEASLTFISHWTPPVTAPKRFSTWFFVARAPEGAVTIDGSEIHEEQWMRPRDAIARRDAREIELAPPTWMTIHYLTQFETVADLLADARDLEPRFYVTRIARHSDSAIAAWEGDSAYESGDFDAPGPRHRLVMREGSWQLEHTS